MPAVLDSRPLRHAERDTSTTPSPRAPVAVKSGPRCDEREWQRKGRAPGGRVRRERARTRARQRDIRPGRRLRAAVSSLGTPLLALQPPIQASSPALLLHTAPLPTALLCSSLRSSYGPCSLVPPLFLRPLFARPSALPIALLRSSLRSSYGPCCLRPPSSHTAALVRTTPPPPRALSSPSHLPGGRLGPVHKGRRRREAPPSVANPDHTTVPSLPHTPGSNCPRKRALSGRLLLDDELCIAGREDGWGYGMGEKKKNNTEEQDDEEPDATGYCFPTVVDTSSDSTAKRTMIAPFSRHRAFTLLLLEEEEKSKKKETTQWAAAFLPRPNERLDGAKGLQQPPFSQHTAFTLPALEEEGRSKKKEKMQWAAAFLLGQTSDLTAQRDHNNPPAPKDWAAKTETPFRSNRRSALVNPSDIDDLGVWPPPSFGRPSP
ncbi:hypothetical protein CDD83_6315 [Cordyceps sp. RAO-2017]|nr:hypothetical protein CDD83_6315 [Cordyceps sp. RAO-2017]